MKRYPRIIPRPNGKGTGFQTMPMVLGDVGVPTMSWGGRSGPRNKYIQHECLQSLSFSKIIVPQ